MGLTVLNVAMKAMKEALGEMAAGLHPRDERRMPFDELYAEVGFSEHYAWEERFEEGASGAAVLVPQARLGIDALEAEHEALQKELSAKFEASQEKLESLSPADPLEKLLASSSPSRDP